MHARKVSHKVVENVCAWMHAARRNAVTEGVLAAIDGRRLSVTGLGRSIDSEAQEKNCIKRADRLIGNEHLYREAYDVYSCFTHVIIGSVQRPVVLVDWSDLVPFKRHFLLRASVAMDGRPLTLYEEVHSLETKEKPTTHRIFLKRLKAMLRKECRPIIVTDSGFRTPWFKLVEEMGWDWVGRIRNRHMVRYSEEDAWFDSKTLYDKATRTPKYLGTMQMTRNSPLHCQFVLYKGKPKGRSKITCNGNRARSKHSEQCARREREPRLLEIYSTRMQIEESFRGVKSTRFGIGFELQLSRAAQRLQVLLLIAMIAHFVLWLLGTAARNSRQHFQYQANTVKDRHALSAIYLGLLVANDRRFRFDIEELSAVGNCLACDRAETWRGMVNSWGSLRV